MMTSLMVQSGGISTDGMDAASTSDMDIDAASAYLQDYTTMMPYLFTAAIAGVIFTSSLVIFTKRGHNENGTALNGSLVIISGIIFLATTMISVFHTLGIR